ncbi:MAG: hypothetical protein IJD14_06035 [Christensenellaceae bacterium]|nr:hypothetical protein [Christensenellaceae bacterium]
MTDIEKTIIKAIELDKLVRIIYESDKGFTERTVRPIKLENEELYAYCYLRRSRRKFKLSGILSAVPQILEKDNG